MLAAPLSLGLEARCRRGVGEGMGLPSLVMSKAVVALGSAAVGVMAQVFVGLMPSGGEGTRVAVAVLIILLGVGVGVSE